MKRFNCITGVGAFGAAMKTLRRKNWMALSEIGWKPNKPYLGICLGFQLLFEESEETQT